jgi:hypothetical protein
MGVPSPITYPSLPAEVLGDKLVCVLMLPSVTHQCQILVNSKQLTKLSIMDYFRDMEKLK